MPLLPEDLPDRIPEPESPLSAYAEVRLDDGDAVLLLDTGVCLEIAGLADHWDDALRARTAEVLAGTARAVTLAIVRPRARLRAGDYQIWRELHAALRTADVQLHPVRALPAA